MPKEFTKQYKLHGKTTCPKCENHSAALVEDNTEWKDLYIVCDKCGLDERN